MAGAVTPRVDRHTLFRGGGGKPNYFPNVRAQDDILVLFRQLCEFSFYANFPAVIFSAAFYLRLIPTL